MDRLGGSIVRHIREHRLVEPQRLREVTLSEGMFRQFPLGADSLLILPKEAAPSPIKHLKLIPDFCVLSRFDALAPLGL